ncbi:hypothetical protein GLOIN_2v1789107 [Rhizophagus clarus]|uniref:F-box domain-containing protein n=1 Tax=Rhizophagus clarus TaxID=94130 RepID=A0A8H3M8J3_9GLOM|nr:hypothetical protein GLOIN_2v1789107 [Rhizophagus clarus]
MVNVNENVIFLILKELENDNQTLFSCLLVNKIWCGTTVPILWKNPLKKSYLTKVTSDILLNVILSHSSEESRNNLKNQGIDLFIIKNPKLLFNILERLTIKNTLIKKLRFVINENVPGITRLIEVQKNLKEVNFFCGYISDNATYRKTLEESLTQCADTLQYLRIEWKPITNHLSNLVNLVSLKIKDSYKMNSTNWSYLRNLSLPHLKFLNACDIPVYIITSLIKNANGNLSEINILNENGYVDEKLIRAIYQNCPNLSYLRLQLICHNDILEFENILINCRFLTGLEIIGTSDRFNWDEFFIVLERSSPINLFKFGFYYNNVTSIHQPIISFISKWMNRQPMILQTVSIRYKPQLQEILETQIQSHKEGAIKKYSHYCGAMYLLWSWSLFLDTN